MISYEVPLLLSSVTVVMIAGSLSLTKIVEAQSGYSSVSYTHLDVYKRQSVICNL